MKKSVILLLFSILVLMLSVPVLSQSVETEVTSVDQIDRHGDILLAITSKELADLGFEYADYVTVSFLDKNITIPVIPAYRYVGAKASGLVIWESEPSRPAELAVTNGSFASGYGLAELFTREDGSRYLEAMEGVEFPVAVKIEMAEKGGYKDTYNIFDLEFSNNYEDYEELPQKIFEIGDVAYLDENVEVKMRTVKKMAGAQISSNANLTTIKSYMESIISNLGFEMILDDYDDTVFIQGRCAKFTVKTDDDKIPFSLKGYFGEVHPQVLTNFDLEYPTIMFEIEFMEK